jgi:DNA-binding NarL/FixJ family response regulator
VGDRRTGVLLDRHPIWLKAVAQVLEGAGIDVVGAATSPRDALALVEERRPDLFVTDVKMGDGEMDGIECLSKARAHASELKSIVLSAYEDEDHIQQALGAGAVAYVVKTAHPDDLASAVRQVFDHSIYLGGARRRRNGTASEVFERPPGLTRRELEILRLAAEGLSNAELAKMLWVTEQTVKFHLSNVYRKLDVANRTEASRWAQIHGLLSAEATATDVSRASAA